MNDRYEPPSEFLRAIVAGDIPIGLNGYAGDNLAVLISMTADQDSTNRDWATMLLAQQEIDTDEVRSALLRAVRDDHDAVRDEALLGLAKIDPAIALPFAYDALAADSAGMAVFEAVEIIADPSLIAALEPWLEESENDFIDDFAKRAMSACQRSTKPHLNSNIS